METLFLLKFLSDFLFVLIVPIRDGNISTIFLASYVEIVLIVPIRDGNFAVRTSVACQFNLF